MHFFRAPHSHSKARHALLGASMLLAAAGPVACGDSGPAAPPPAGEVANTPMQAEWKERAAGYLEQRTGAWLAAPPPISNVGCAMTCHTTFPYLLGAHAFAPIAMPNAEAARARMLARVAEGATAKAYYGAPGSAKETESWATEAVLNAAVLGMEGARNPQTARTNADQAYARLWATQNSQGTWDWLEFGLFPWETRKDWGCAMSVMTARMSAHTGDPGYAKAIGYLQQRVLQTAAPMSLHDRIATLWASRAEPALLTAEQTNRIERELQDTQLADGGYSIGKFEIGALAGSRTSAADGYATAIATLALCTQPGGKALPQVRRALNWFARNQRADGTWVGRSVNRDVDLNNGFMTDAATAYGVLAVYTCSE